MEICTTDRKNISHAGCIGDYGTLAGAYIDYSGSTGLAYADAKLEANWIAKINAATDSRMYIINPKPIADEYAFDGDERQTTRSTTGKLILGRDGYDGIVFTYYNPTLAQVNRLRTFHNTTAPCYFYTNNEDIIADKNTADTNIVGVNCNIYVSKFKNPENNDGNEMVTVSYYPTKTTDWQTKVLQKSELDFVPSELTGITDVVATIVSSSVAGQEVVMNITGVPDGNEISSLSTVGDHLMTIVSSGAAVTLSSVTNVGNVYTFVTSGMTAVPLSWTLANQPPMTVKGYENQTPLVFTPDA